MVQRQIILSGKNYSEVELVSAAEVSASVFLLNTPQGFMKKHVNIAVTVPNNQKMKNPTVYEPNLLIS